MIKSGFYSTYQDKQYRLGKHDKVSVNLISDNSEEEANGFIKFASDPDLYKKTVALSEIGYVYSIHTFGIYKEHKLRVESEKDNELFLVTSDLEALKACGLEWLDRGFYGISLDKSEVTLFEEKDLVPNFFGEND